MGAVEKFEINLEHDIDEQYQYEPGEMLRGHVLLVLTQSIKLKNILAQIKGEATVSWEDEGRNPLTYRADETYIDVTQNLLTAPPGESQTLEKGRHKFALEYVLPMNLPSSFIGKFGSITYVVKATLKEDKKFGLSTLITSEPFLVLRRLDISKDEALMREATELLEKRMFGALAFCLSGKIEAELVVNKRGHLPGEDIFMDAEITNSSPRIVKAVQASIIMHSTFYAKHNTRYNTQIVNKKRDEWEMSYGEGRRWKNVRLTIPPYIPESRLDGCDIIDIRYELLFKIDISGGHEMKCSIPLVVGTTQGEVGTQSNKPRVWRGGVTQGGGGDGYMTPADVTKDPNQNGDVNGEEYAGLPNDIDLDDISMDDDEHDKFRYPMAPGETRRNPLYANAADLAE